MQIIIIAILSIIVIILTMYILSLRIDINILEGTNKMKVTHCTVDVKYIKPTDIIVDGKPIKPCPYPHFILHILSNLSAHLSNDELQYELIRFGYFISYSDLIILKYILSKENISENDIFN